MNFEHFVLEKESFGAFPKIGSVIRLLFCVFRRHALTSTAKKLVKEMGLTTEQAAKATGLTPEEFMNN